MLLPKEENLSSEYLLRGLPDSAKASIYMPPIKSSDKLTKQFLSPSQFQSSKRLVPFPFQQTPKREYGGVKLDVRQCILLV